MPVTLQLATASDVSHLHRWTWTREPDAILALCVDSHVRSCAHLFSLLVERPGQEDPLPVVGLGGIATDAMHRRNGCGSRLLTLALLRLVREGFFRGALLNGQGGSRLWYGLGFTDIGPSPTRRGQSLWWHDLGSGEELGDDFEILPKGFHW